MSLLKGEILGSTSGQELNLEQMQWPCMLCCQMQIINGNWWAVCSCKSSSSVLSCICCKRVYMYYLTLPPPLLSRLCTSACTGSVHCWFFGFFFSQKVRTLPKLGIHNNKDGGLVWREEKWLHATKKTIVIEFENQTPSQQLEFLSPVFIKCLLLMCRQGSDNCFLSLRKNSYGYRKKREDKFTVSVHGHIHL